MPAREGRFVKGFYPLPGGLAVVIFRLENGPDGSFTLVSDGRRFGEAGYYRVHHTGDGALLVKCVCRWRRPYASSWTPRICSACIIRSPSKGYGFSPCAMRPPLVKPHRRRFDAL